MMVKIPEPKSFVERLLNWQNMSTKLKADKIAELLFRKDLYDEAFPSPVEGANYYPLPENYRLQAYISFNYEVDETWLDQLRTALAEIGVNMDELISWKPKLNVRAYKELEHTNPQAREMIDHIITKKPNTPQFEIQKVTDDMEDRNTGDPVPVKQEEEIVIENTSRKVGKRQKAIPKAKKETKKKAPVKKAAKKTKAKKKPWE